MGKRAFVFLRHLSSLASSVPVVGCCEAEDADIGFKNRRGCEIRTKKGVGASCRS